MAGPAATNNKNVDSVEMTITNSVLLPNLHWHLRGKHLLENAGACPQTP